MRWVALVAVASCNGSSGAPDAPIAIDAARDASRDAPAIDAVFDAGIDALPDSSLDPIAITVWAHDGSAVLPNAEVHFLSAAYDVKVMTDATGVAIGRGEPNTTIYVVQPGPLGILVRWFFAVEPGANIVTGRRTNHAFADIGDITYTLPTHPNAAAYNLGVSCSARIQGTQTQPVLRASMCPDATSATAVATVIDASGAIIAASTLTGLDLTTLGGTTVAMPAYTTPLTTFTSSITNAPAGSTTIWSEAYYGGASNYYSWGQYSNPATPTMVLATVGNRTLSRVTFSKPGNQWDYIRGDLSSITSIVVDGDDRVSAPGLSSFDRVTRTLSWTDTPGRSPTVVKGDVEFVDPSRHLSIQFVAPAGMNPIVFPDIDDYFEVHASDDNGVFVIENTIVEGADYKSSLETTTTDDDRVSPPSFTKRIWRGKR